MVLSLANVSMLTHSTMRVTMVALHLLNISMLTFSPMHSCASVGYRLTDTTMAGDSCFLFKGFE